MSKKSRRNSIRSHSLQTHREFYSDEQDRREDLERRAQQAVHGENSARDENLKDDNYWKPIHRQIKLRVREYTCVVNWR